MTFLSKMVRDRIQRIVCQPTYVERMVEGGYQLHPRMSKKSYSAAEVLAGEPTRREPDRSTAELDKWDKWLERTGGNELLRVSKGKSSVMAGKTVYSARCACGARLRLTAREVVARNDAQVGCCSPACAAPGIDKQVWYGPIAAIRLQLGQLVARHPESVDPRWGGQSLIDSAVQIRKEQLGRPLLPYGCWWFKGVREHRFKEVKDIQFGTLPDRWILPFAGVVVKWDGEVFPLDEVAEAYGVDMQRAMRLRMSYFDNEVIDKLIGE